MVILKTSTITYGGTENKKLMGELKNRMVGYGCILNGGDKNGRCGVAFPSAVNIKRKANLIPAAIPVTNSLSLCYFLFLHIKLQ